MATTSTPLIWNYFRKNDAASVLGGVLHYYDEESQSLYLNDGLKTKLADVPEGHWKTSEESDEILISNDAWQTLRLDHPSTGILYGISNNGTSMEFWKYRYAMDISDLFDSWSITEKSDTPIVQMNGDVKNISADIFSADSSLYQPGSKITMRVSLGDSKPATLATIYLDETRYNILNETVSISGRSSSGWMLKDQTFDENVLYTDTAITEILADILYRAGVVDAVIQEMPMTDSFEFKASGTYLDAITTILNKHSIGEHAYSIIQLPEGTICIGRDDWLDTYSPKTEYVFNEGREVFTRETNRKADAAYSYLRVTGRDANNNDLAPIMMPVNKYQYWTIGEHKTKHVNVSEIMTQESLQAYAQALASRLQYTGIGESFSSPFRPQLVLGDVAEVTSDGETAMSLGLINEIEHSFSSDRGYSTTFNVDSGGDKTDRGYNIYTQSASINGYNRKQNIMDIIKMAAASAQNKLGEEDMNEVTAQTVHDIWEALEDL